MPDLHVSLFGQLTVTARGQVLTGFRAGKLQELFGYLLLHRDRPSPREALASLLWEHATTDTARAYLRTALWRLRGHLRAGRADDAPPVLLVGPDWVQVSPELDLWLDAELFEHAFQEAEGVPGSRLSEAQARMLSEAVDLYEGDLLANHYEAWCLYERERFRHLYLVMLDKLASHCEAQGRFEVGAGYAERILTHDRAREHTHRQLMRLRASAGDRTGALHQFEACRQSLHEELDVAPDAETRLLYEDIRQGLTPSAPAPHILGAYPNPSRESPEVVLDELKRALTLLAQAQQQLQHQVEALEERLVQPAVPLV